MTIPTPATLAASRPAPGPARTTAQLAEELAAAASAMDIAYDLKGIAARDTMRAVEALRAARARFAEASRHLAHMEAAHRQAEAALSEARFADEYAALKARMAAWPEAVA